MDEGQVSDESRMALERLGTIKKREDVAFTVALDRFLAYYVHGLMTKCSPASHPSLCRLSEITNVDGRWVRWMYIERTALLLEIVNCVLDQVELSETKRDRLFGLLPHISLSPLGVIVSEASMSYDVSKGGFSQLEECAESNEVETVDDWGDAQAVIRKELRQLVVFLIDAVHCRREFIAADEKLNGIDPDVAHLDRVLQGLRAAPRARDVSAVLTSPLGCSTGANRSDDGKTNMFELKAISNLVIVYDTITSELEAAKLAVRLCDNGIPQDRIGTINFDHLCIEAEEQADESSQGQVPRALYIVYLDETSDLIWCAFRLAMLSRALDSSQILLYTKCRDLLGSELAPMFNIAQHDEMLWNAIKCLNDGQTGLFA